MKALHKWIAGGLAVLMLFGGRIMVPASGTPDTADVSATASIERSAGTVVSVDDLVATIETEVPAQEGVTATNSDALECHQAALEGNEKSPFSDVSPDGEFYEAINACWRAGIIRGVGDNLFRPENEASPSEFGLMYLRYMTPDYELESISGNWELDAISAVHRAGMDISIFSNTSFMYTCGRILDIQKWPLFDREVWGDKYWRDACDELTDGLVFKDRDAWLATGIAYGLLDDIELHDGGMTRGEMAQVFYNLMLIDGKTLPLPQFVQDYPLDYQIEDDWGPQREMYRAMVNVPEKYLKAYKKRGWNIRIIDVPIHEYRKEYADMTEAVGLTSYTRHEMLVSVADTRWGNDYILAHEFGHFVSDYEDMYLPSDIFSKEKQALSDTLREYAATNEDEALADVFENIVLNGHIDEVEEQIPETYQWVWDAFFGDDYEHVTISSQSPYVPRVVHTDTESESDSETESDANGGADISSVIDEDGNNILLVALSVLDGIEGV